MLKSILFSPINSLVNDFMSVRNMIEMLAFARIEAALLSSGVMISQRSVKFQSSVLKHDVTCS